MRHLREKYNLITMTRAGAIFPSYRMVGHELSSFNSKRFDYIANASRKGDILLIVNNYSQDLDPSYTSRGNPVLPPRGRIKKLKLYIEKLSTLSKSLQSKGVHVVVMLPLPNFNSSELSFNLANCRNSLTLNKGTLCKPSIVLRSEMLSRNKEVVEMLSAYAERGGYSILNPFDDVCPKDNNFCSTHTFEEASSSMIPIFRDYDHLSRHGAKIIAPTLESFLINLE